MADFLSTTAISAELEKIIKSANARLVLISPFLKLSDRIRELIEDRDRLKVDVRIIYGKTDLHPEEVEWLKGLEYVRTSFCRNLHAKCYLNETACIITSLNLHKFSKENNNEMGVLICKETDTKLYEDTYEEVQRLIRISDEVKISLEKIAKTGEEKTIPSVRSSAAEQPDSAEYTTLTSAKLAKKIGFKSAAELQDKAVEKGLLEKDGDFYLLTNAGKEAGISFRKGKFGIFFIWPEDFSL